MLLPSHLRGLVFLYLFEVAIVKMGLFAFIFFFSPESLIVEYVVHS